MRYYFLGIGGIGMSALARYFKQRGDEVSGYDRTPSDLTRALEKEGIAVHYDDDPSQIPIAIDLVVYTPAIPADNKEFQYLQAEGVPMKKRSEVLGDVTRNKRCIAVAGTHGKTSTSSMIAYLLSNSSLGCSAFLGGIAKNFDSNVVIDTQSEYVVVEADEYDRSFLQLSPYFSVITSIDPDHLDIYGDYEHLREAFAQFAGKTTAEGKVFLKNGVSLFPDEEDEDEHEHHHHHDHHHGDSSASKLQAPVVSYTVSGVEADYYAWNVRSSRGNIYFDLRTPQGVIFDMELRHTSLYNVENAVVAAAVAMECGLSERELRYGLKTYDGVRRRFDYRLESKELVYIDDYAHHPRELAATIESVRYLYPGKRVVGIFQPHLYSRTADFADEFAKVLSSLDEAILLPIYPAREKPIPGVSSGMILRKMDTMSKYLVSKDQVTELLEALYPDVVLTMGAGDIDRLVPVIEQALKDNL